MKAHTKGEHHAEKNSTRHPPELNPLAGSFVPSTMTAVWVNSTNTVLLQTAKADVYNLARPQSVTKISILLDVGSQRWYITKQVQKALALPILKQQKMLIKTFGSEQVQVLVCDVVNIGLKTIDGNAIELTLLSVPLICEPLSHQSTSTFKSSHEHLALLNIADIDDGTS